MVSWNFIAVGIQVVKALLCFVLVPFFFPSPKLDEGKKTFEDDTAVIIQLLRLLHSFPLIEEWSLKLKLQISSGHGGNTEWDVPW